MKKILLTEMILAFVCGIALAEGGGTVKGHECPLAMAEKAAGGKKHDCPMAAKAAGEKHDCRHAGAKQARHPCPDTIKGVDSASKNTGNGVRTTMTAKDKGIIARVQKSAHAHYLSREKMCKDCPAKIEGAETKLTDTETGVIVEITGKTPETIQKIQAASAKGIGPKAAGHKCGMDLAEKK